MQWAVILLSQSPKYSWKPSKDSLAFELNSVNLGNPLIQPVHFSVPLGWQRSAEANRLPMQDSSFKRMKRRFWTNSFILIAFHSKKNTIYLTMKEEKLSEGRDSYFVIYFLSIGAGLITVLGSTWVFWGINIFITTHWTHQIIMTKIVASKRHPELNIVSPIAKRPILNSR